MFLPNLKPLASFLGPKVRLQQTLYRRMNGQTNGRRDLHAENGLECDADQVYVYILKLSSGRCKRYDKINMPIIERENIRKRNESRLRTNP